jgi:hypothetical protein
MLGNIGKAGLVMLIAPRDPMVREMDSERWRYADYPEFDGKPEDCFNRASLHLSFTNYHVPIFNSKVRGEQDSPSSMLESIISVRDSGLWVADVNILSALEEDAPVYRLDPPRCGHSAELAPNLPITSVECWDDVLDCPEGNFMVKARGNWLARLAIAAVLANHSRMKRKRITICPPSLFWRCVKQDFPHNAYVY